MSALTNIISKATTIPYIAGGQSNNIPFNVQLQIDPNFQRTIYRTAGILSLGVAAGIAVGLVIAKHRR